MDTSEKRISIRANGERFELAIRNNQIIRVRHGASGSTSPGNSISVRKGGRLNGTNRFQFQIDSSCEELRFVVTFTEGASSYVPTSSRNIPWWDSDFEKVETPASKPERIEYTLED